MLLNLIGLISGVLGIVGFVQDQLPEKPDPEKDMPDKDPVNIFGTTLRLTVGLAGAKDPNGGDPLADPNGSIVQVVHYDNAGKLIGSQAAPGEIKDGNFVDIKHYSTNGHQAASTTIWGTPQNVCIATMGVTFSDGLQFGWTGDWGKICHLPSYYSGIIMSDGQVPYCTWLSWTGETSTPAHKISVEWAKFKLADDDKNVPSDEDAQKMCGAAFKAFNVDSGEKQILGPGNENPGKRSVARYGRSDERLIVSSRSGMNATTLCEEENSYGPDFVSLHEGIYCNMDTRDTLPVCAPGVLGECFDVETASHVESNGKRRRTIQPRNPSDVIHWD